MRRLLRGAGQARVATISMRGATERTILCRPADESLQRRKSSLVIINYQAPSTFL
jgi:hypothetical protein